jgi:CO/xanthine dehydrogenase Mo-binding subunit
MGRRRPARGEEVTMLIARPTTLSITDDDVVRGAGTRWTDLENDLADVLPSLAAGARTVGSPQMRNAGTVGGHVGIEQPELASPYGAKGVGEPATISATGAVLAAHGQATGLLLNRIPVWPDDIAPSAEPAASTG